MTRLAVLMTCFNRRETTLASLRALAANPLPPGMQSTVYLVDDGSTDGTASAVAGEFPTVRVLGNDGPPLFWCRGMHRAFAAAIADRCDAYLLLNDDTMLFPDALPRLLADAQAIRSMSPGPSIVVGSTRDAASGVHSYGGERRPRASRRTTFSKVAPQTTPQRVDSFDGNVVLLPADVVARIGNLDPAYEHAMGDLDYGLRATSAGVGVWLASGYHGACTDNPVKGTFGDRSMAWGRRWRHLLGRKGLPWRSWLHFTRRHAGWNWPVFFAWPYVRLMLEGLRGVVQPSRHEGHAGGR